MKSIPKVELHCHLEGIVDPNILKQLEQRGKKLPLSSQEFSNYYPVNNMDSFIRWCEGQDYFQGNILSYLDILKLHIERLISENVIYTEIQFAPGELPMPHHDAIDMMKQFKKEVESFEKEQLQVEFLCCIARQVPEKRLAHIIERTLLLHKENLVVGVNIAGLEKGFPIPHFKPYLEQLHTHGIPVSIHAGEWAGVDSIRDALDNAKPQRLGHAVTAFSEEHILQEIKEKKIHLEFCPISNLKTGSISDLKQHPLLQAKRKGISFSLSTDDPGAFENTMTQEYQVAKDFGLTENDLFNITKSGLDAGFCNEFRVKSIKDFYSRF